MYYKMHDDLLLSLDAVTISNESPYRGPKFYITQVHLSRGVARYFASKRKNYIDKLKISEEELKKVNNFRYLGTVVANGGMDIQVHSRYLSG